MALVCGNAEAHLLATPWSSGRRTIIVQANDEKLYINRRSIESSYSDELIRLIFSFKGPSYACDEIARDEDPKYVRMSLENAIFPYVRREDFAGKRILDFGCGSGASTMHLFRMFPHSEILGVELDPSLLSIAKARAAHYGFPAEKLLLSPTPQRLPDGIGDFDFVILSAVYEHLLPNERPQVLRHIWSVLRPSGYLFLNQTPYRYAIVETHTTGLPFINFLPDKWTHRAACLFSRTVSSDESWETLLRRGIRGGSELEILEHIRRFGHGEPILLEPSPSQRVRDRIDLWYQLSSSARYPALKKGMRALYKSIKAVTGRTLVPSLSLAIQKQARSESF